MGTFNMINNSANSYDLLIKTIFDHFNPTWPPKTNLKKCYNICLSYDVLVELILHGTVVQVRYTQHPCKVNSVQNSTPTKSANLY